MFLEGVGHADRRVERNVGARPRLGPAQTALDLTQVLQILVHTRTIPGAERPVQATSLVGNRIQHAPLRPDACLPFGR